MAIDRSDIRFAVKELTRHMSKPRYEDYKQLVHMGRYILGKPRVVTTCKYQKNYKIIDVWSDTDHAGFLETRESNLRYSPLHVAVAGAPPTVYMHIGTGETEGATDQGTGDRGMCERTIGGKKFESVCVCWWCFPCLLVVYGVFLLCSL